MNRLYAVLATALLVAPMSATMADPFASSAADLSYGDLDLATPAGQAGLDVRLANAAADVCGRGLDRVHSMLAQQAAVCKAEVIAETRARIDRRIATRSGPMQAGQN